MKTLSEIVAGRKEAVILEKIAAVEEQLGSDPAVVEAFSTALDVVKEAGYTDPSEAIDRAFALVLQHFDIEKTAEEKQADEMQKIAEELGVVAAQVAAAAGITIEDLEKIGSPEEAELFGRTLAQATHRVIEGKTGKA